MGLTQVEERANEIQALFQADKVERTRDAIQIDIDGERGVVLLVTAEALELRLPTVEWTDGAYGPQSSSRLWKRRLWRNMRNKRNMDLQGLIQSEINKRQSEFILCRYCHQPTPPEHRHGKACQGCASKHEGVVY